MSLTNKFQALRVKLAHAIAPPLAPSSDNTHRYVAVRFYPPGVPPQVVVFDRENAEHCAAWDENSRFYRSQIIASGGDHEAMKGMETP
ncbi:hypothetical protein [Bosea vaviloviae]|nr:hypothetical protein [Bosea vaviloviae]